MKRFLINVMIFLGGYMLLNCATFIWITRPHVLKSYSVSMNAPNCRIALVADSRGKALGTDIPLREGILNVSAASDSYYDMYLKVRELSQLGAIDTILLSVDDHTLSPYRELNNNLSLSIFLYARPSDYSPSLAMTYPKFLFNLYLRYYFPLLDTNNSQVFLRMVKSRFTKGKPVQKSWEQLTQNERRKACIIRSRNQFPSAVPSYTLEQSLKEIVTFCKQKKITLIGIKFPLTSEYLAILGTRSFHADSILVKEHIPILDFGDCFISKGDFFSNTDHLNSKGGAAFASILRDRLHAITKERKNR
jgi:hypothetical protein